MEIVDDSVKRRLALDFALRSHTFERSPSSKKLLTYLFERNGHHVNEYSVATEVMGRRSNFDPQVDASVRVHVSRLRSRLIQLYDREGDGGNLRIEIPKGGYELHFSGKVKMEASPTKVKLQELWVLGAVVCLVIFLFLGWKLAQTNSKGTSLEPDSNVADSFWDPFLKGTKSVRIVLPNPVFFVWKEPGTNRSVRVRATSIDDYEKFRDSPTLRKFGGMLGKSELSQDYVAANDAFSAVTLTHFLTKRGVSPEVVEMANTPTRFHDDEALILVGTGGTLSPYSHSLKGLDLSIPVNSLRLDDSSPKPGYPSHFDVTVESPERRRIPQIIACLPSDAKGGKILLMEGTQTSALIDFMLSSEGISQLDKAKQEAKVDSYFQAVVEFDMSGKTVLKSRLLLLKPLRDVGIGSLDTKTMLPN